MFGKATEAIVKTTAPIVVGRFDALMAPRFVRLPAKRAEHLIAVGHAVRVTEADVPTDAQVVHYSEADFVAPHTKPKPPSSAPLDTADVLRRFNWTRADLESAMTCGFPSADLTRFVMTPGDGGATRVPQWRAETIDAWCQKIRALKVR